MKLKTFKKTSKKNAKKLRAFKWSVTYKREIIVSVQMIGFHSWPKAPKEVSFLRNRHRHVFHVKAGIAVKHNDRDREFFMEQTFLRKVLRKHFNKHEENVGSCESICEFLLNTLPYVRWVQVEEDGENGARLDRS